MHNHIKDKSAGLGGRELFTADQIAARLTTTAKDVQAVADQLGIAMKRRNKSRGFYSHSDFARIRAAIEWRQATAARSADDRPTKGAFGGTGPASIS